MNLDPGLGEAFQTKTLVSEFHCQVNKAVAAIWVHTAAAPAELAHPLFITDSSSSVNQGFPRVSYLAKTKLPSFNGQIAGYPDFKSQFTALIKNCGYPIPSLIEKMCSSDF